MILPAIDLQNGQSVRLYQGDFTKETIISPAPVKQAKEINAAGVYALHLVDLDGAKAGFPKNLAVIKKIRAEFTGLIEVGGGIRSLDTIETYLAMGIDRLILGSVALKDPAFTKQVLAKFGPERIVIGVDGTDGKVAVDGWLKQSEVMMATLINEMQQAGAKHFIVTDVAKDGTMTGVNMDLLTSLQKQFPQANIIASGGIRDLQDILALQAAGIADAVAGKALYEGSLTLEEIAGVNGC